MRDDKKTPLGPAGMALLGLVAALLCLAGVASANVCPDGMEFVPGGNTQVVYSGERWGGTIYQAEWVDDFCIDKYEASQPDATTDSMGSWDGSDPIPAAQSQLGVLPWVTMSWNEATQACLAAGKRLPTLAEWQTAYSGYNGAFWPWGSDDYDADQAAACYMDMPSPPPFSYPTGGCCFENCLGGQCFTTCDMPGNIAEFIDGLWDEGCYGNTQILVASAGISQWYQSNSQKPDPDNPGCWVFVTFAQRRYGLHHHHPDDGWFVDDGFRCAKSASDDDTTDDDTMPDDDTTIDDDSTPDDDAAPDDDTTPDDDATPDDDTVDDDAAPDDDTVSDDDATDDDASGDDSGGGHSGCGC